MDWRPEWEPLADALKRVIDAGTLPEIARHRICTDIAQDQIRICPYVGSETTGKPDVRLRSPRHYRVPQHLEPGDFDWENSRPLQPWSVNRTGNYYGWEDAAINLIELKTDDVIDRLCSNSGASVVAKTGTFERIEATRQPDTADHAPKEAASLSSFLPDQTPTGSSAQTEGNERSSEPGGSEPRYRLPRKRGKPEAAAHQHRNDILALLAIAKREYPPPKSAKLSFNEMARNLETVQDRYRWSAISQILRGKYPNMKKLEIESPYVRKRA
jgi:hypothetical protein